MAISVEELLERARAALDRVPPEELEREVDAGALLVDIRPAEQRERDGELPGAIVIDRNVLEWRLAPSSEWKTVEVGEDQRVIVVCNDGYQSSLAAANLQELGLRGATDVVGGFTGWHAWRERLAPRRNE